MDENSDAVQKIMQIMMQAPQPDPWAVSPQAVVPSVGWGNMPMAQPMPISTYGANSLMPGLGYADHFTLEGNYRARRPR